MQSPAGITTTAPQPADAGEERGRRELHSTALFLGLVLISLLCWIQLARWYSLFDNYHIDFFAFEKIPGRFDSPIIRRTIGLFLILGLCYAAGLGLLHRMPSLSRVVRAGIITAWLGPGLCNVWIFPVGALDIFRYMIALKMQYFFNENAYVHGFTHHNDDPWAKHAFLLHLPNAKGPVWLLISAIPAYLAGFDDQQRLLLALKLFNLLLIGLVAALLYWAVGRGKHGWFAAFLFAANPLVLFEGVGVVHNDVMTAGFLVAGLIALQRRSWLALPCFIAAALVKYFGFQFLPLVFLVMLVRRWEIRRVVLSIVAAAIVVALSIAPFWEGGEMYHGITRVGQRYESFPHVSLVSLERQVRMEEVPSSEWRAVESRRYLFAGLFMALSLPALATVWKGASPAHSAVAIYLLFLLFVTLLYPWYLIPVVAVMGLTATRLDYAYLVVATTLGLIYYPFYVWAHFSSGYSLLDRHLFLSLFLTIPIVIYLLLWYGDQALRFRRFSHGGSAPRHTKIARPIL